MPNHSTPWNAIFASQGLVFVEPHEDMPQLAEQISQGNAHTLLDLGCGSGRHVLYFGERGFDMYGIDSAPAGLAITRQRLEEAGLTAHLVQSDIFDALPFPDAFFDAILSVQVIHHARLAQIAALIDEMARILKVGGHIFVTVPQLQNQGTQFAQIEPGTYIPLDGIEAGLPHHYFTPEELRTLFKAFSILDIHLDRHQHYCLTAVKHSAPTAEVSR
ncbi:class I SAM-dependent methyltransferase [Ktedonosporobacter rubrisoli]|uniref:Class I SAM-dependent methyltransferase n=1 Tax=Ktedonosporobacter rubrisoli TaxID=2509675 RepID=A0A4P6K051_KTERU|nr:class I SAM-dependent methyltransferase [Ktedonosporobacter rubrisoli]QBD81163.1 class I SAM-dependent methyltransferase [Ktedonosporobacter rubrisoli]